MSLELLGKPCDTKAWDRFVEIGLPNKKDEAYRYVRLKELYSHPFATPSEVAVAYQPQESTLVFVNGAYSEHLSRLPKPAIPLPLSEAFATYGSYLTARLNKLSKEEKDPFAALNGAYSTEGLFLYLPPKCHATIRVVHIVDQLENPSLLSPRIHLFAGKEAAASLSFETSGKAENMWINAYMDCALEERAHVTLTYLHDLPETAHHFEALRATLKRESVLKSYSVTKGSATSREDYVVRLQGEQAEAALHGVWSLKENCQHHVHLWMDHQEPACTSLQKFKGTLADASRSSFEGKIYVHQKAQKTQAYQMNNNLVLGGRAQANSKPNLEIFADDVKASHGATVGQIDPEHLFYFTARGIPAPLAQALLVRGFTQEVIDLIPDPQLREKALRMLV